MLAKKLILFLLLPFFLLGFFAFISPVSAQSNPGSDSNYGLTETKTVGNVASAMIDQTPQEIAGTVVGAILSLLGVIFFLLIFYGGIRWMLAQGNEAEVEKAKQVIVAAVIGLVVVLSAYAITYFIGQRLTGG
jgi:cbb3-type cytochrome oxidase subunit 3